MRGMVFLCCSSIFAVMFPNMYIIIIVTIIIIIHVHIIIILSYYNKRNAHFDV